MSLLPDVTLSEDMLALRGSEGPVRLYSYRGGLLALQEAYRLIACHYRRSRVQWDAKAHSCHSLPYLDSKALLRLSPEYSDSTPGRVYSLRIDLPAM